MQKRYYVVKGVVVLALIATAWGLAPSIRPPLARVRVGIAAGIDSTGGALVRPLPKLRVRAGNPHLIEDENGRPIFIAGVCPQNIIHWCTPDKMDTYFADRQARHFNFAWVVINGFNMSPGKPDMLFDVPATNPVDGRGNSMLLHGQSWNPRNLNPAYVASVDAMVQSAAKHDLYLFLDPFSCGYGGDPGDFDPSKHSTDEMRQWGEFWGKRYKNYSHVNFAFGNDRLIWPQVDSVADGLKEYMPDRLMTIDWIGGPPDYSNDAKGPHNFYDAGHRWVNFNAWYQYHAPQWATWSHYNMVNPVMPTCIFETFYEHCTYGNLKSPAPPLRMRQQVWGTMLNGGSGFGILGCPDDVDDPMKWLGKTPGLEQAQFCTDFFANRRWYDLVPDWPHTFLKSQLGTPGKDDFAYVSAALARDGSLGLCYYPGEDGKGFHLIINMSKMGGGARSSRARWLDPTNGIFKVIGRLANSGSHTFTTPGANSNGDVDWLLVLEGD